MLLLQLMMLSLQLMMLLVWLKLVMLLLLLVMVLLQSRLSKVLLLPDQVHIGGGGGGGVVVVRGGGVVVVVVVVVVVSVHLSMFVSQGCCFFYADMSMPTPEHETVSAPSRSKL